MSDENKVSVSDFKNWLSGVLDFQPDDWTPNETQWAKIKDKIDQLDETPTVVNVKAEAPVQSNQKQAAPRHPRPQAPLDDQARVKLPDEPAAPKQQHVTVKKTGQPQVIKGEKGRVIDTGVVHEMGVIDTSEEDYQTSFI